MPAVQDTVERVRLIDVDQYKYGFETLIESEKAPKGLNEDTVRFISAKKNEPAWLLEWRLGAYRHWLTMREPKWARVDYAAINYQDIYYYAAPKQAAAPKSLDEVDPEILKTYEKLGIPLREQELLAGVVRQTPGAIGYVELAYVVQAKMHQASLKNKNGKFVQASVGGATAAAAQNANVSPTNFSITDEPGDGTYPIAGFSWIILHASISDGDKGKAIVYLLKWLVTDGQTYGHDLQYAPLPSSVQSLALQNLHGVTAGGQPVLG